MSKKQKSSDGIGEQLAAVVKIVDENPFLVRLMFNPNVQKIGQALFLFVYDKAKEALESKPQPQALPPSYVDEQQEAFTDEQQEAFTPAPFWHLTEDQPVGFVNGFFPVYESPYSRHHRGVGMFW